MIGLHNQKPIKFYSEIKGKIGSGKATLWWQHSTADAATEYHQEYQEFSIQIFWNKSLKIDAVTFTSIEIYYCLKTNWNFANSTFIFELFMHILIKTITCSMRKWDFWKGGFFVWSEGRG